MKLTDVSTDKNYGYESKQKTSIKVGKIENERAYLNALLGPNGESIQYNRIGSCCAFKSKTAAFGEGFLDKYEIYYHGLTKPIILYLNGYDYETPKCPVGFTFKTADKIEIPIKFSSENILKINSCNDNLFSVDNSFLKEKVGNLPLPDSNPKFKGGVDELKRYFVDNPLTNKNAENIVFRVHIGFLVDCNGNAGNFQLLSKGKGELETLANDVLKIVNYMPQNWETATKNEEKVDCYQVLSFTVTSGQLDKVAYK
jgi:hypothetical protein